MTIKPKVLCFGESLVDCFASGMQIGGAPLNVASHLAKLGCDSFLASRVADDEVGKLIIQHLATFGIHSNYLTTTCDVPSGVVTVTEHERGHTFTIAPDSAWDYIDQPKENNTTSVNACVYGTLALRKPTSRAACERMLAMPHRLSICDFNWREGHINIELAWQMAKQASWLKISDEELGLLCKHLGVESLADLKTLGNFDLVILTKGADGYECLHGEALIKGPAAPIVRLVDTVGAGDSFLAGTVAAYLQGMSLERALAFAAKFASFICSQRGAIPTDLSGYNPFLAQIQKAQSGANA